MSRKHFFVDEAGNFDFSHNQGASRYFILASVTMDDAECRVAESLLNLRRDLAWEGYPLTDAFHATDDKQHVRDRIFDLITGMDIRVDATIVEKRKKQHHLQNMEGLYKLTWYLHARHVIPKACPPNDELLVIAASLGTRKQQKLIGRGIRDVVDQCERDGDNTRVSYWPSLSDPCLQITDYCCWAIQRKWERNDDRSYVLIKDLIKTEKDIFAISRTTYY